MKKILFCLTLALVLCVDWARAQVPPAPPAQTTQPVQIGVYLGAGCPGRNRLDGYERWLGRKVDRVHDGLAQDSWTAMVGAVAYVAKCWDGVNREMTLFIPMLPRDGKSTIVEGAQGKYDDYFRSIAGSLIWRGYGNSVIRLGPEFNASWFPWTSVKQPAAWAEYWRRIVRTMRSVPNANFRFDWNVACYAGAPSPEAAYPGDEYVDFIGCDVYNASWNPAVATGEQRWNAVLNAQYGLNWHRQFAAAHGKPMSYPEWGTGTRPDGHGGGDDPIFIARMANWIRGNNVAYHMYWDYPAPDYNAKLSDGSKPAAAAAFLREFGVVK